MRSFNIRISLHFSPLRITLLFTQPQFRWFGIVDADGTPKYSNLADGFCPSETRLRETAAALEREAGTAIAEEEEKKTQEEEHGRAH